MTSRLRRTKKKIVREVAPNSPANNYSSAAPYLNNAVRRDFSNRHSVYYLQNAVERPPEVKLSLACKCSNVRADTLRHKAIQFARVWSSLLLTARLLYRIIRARESASSLTIPPRIALLISRMHLMFQRFLSYFGDTLPEERVLLWLYACS